MPAESSQLTDPVQSCCSEISVNIPNAEELGHWRCHTSLVPGFFGGGKAYRLVALTSTRLLQPDTPTNWDANKPGQIMGSMKQQSSHVEGAYICSTLGFYHKQLQVEAKIKSEPHLDCQGPSLCKCRVLREHNSSG